MVTKEELIKLYEEKGDNKMKFELDGVNFEGFHYMTCNFTGFSLEQVITDLYTYAYEKLFKGRVGLYGRSLILHYANIEDKEYLMVRKYRSYYA